MDPDGGYSTNPSNSIDVQADAQYNLWRVETAYGEHLEVYIEATGGGDQDPEVASALVWSSIGRAEIKSNIQLYLNDIGGSSDFDLTSRNGELGYYVDLPGGVVSSPSGYGYDGTVTAQFIPLGSSKRPNQGASALGIGAVLGEELTLALSGAGAGASISVTAALSIFAMPLFLSGDRRIPDPPGYQPASLRDLIPEALAVGVAVKYYEGQQIVEKMNREINRILLKAAGPPGFVYKLTATVPGYYLNKSTGGLTWLNAGEVWKYGKTVNGLGRYTPSEMANQAILPVQMTPIYFGTTVDFLVQEKIYIYTHFFMHGEKPPGNSIFR